MPVRPLARKRRLVVESDDDEILSPPLSKSSRRVVPSRTHSDTVPPPPTTTTTRRITSGSSSSREIVPRAASAAIPATKCRRLNTVSKFKQIVPPPEKGVPANDLMHSVPSGSQRATSSSQSRRHSASQHEDLDDLIVDSSSDDDHHVGQSNANKVPLTKLSSNSSSQTTTRKYGVSSTGGGGGGFGKAQSRTESSHTTQFTTQRDNGSAAAGNHLELRGPSLFQAATVPKSKTVVTDSRPWPERFAPKSSVDLAVHPKKVAEVRSWLEHVLDGFSKQRLLILKGSAGTGKTATINALSHELGLEILEWKNPTAAGGGGAYGEESAFSSGLAGVFEEFVGRAGRFGSLEMAPTSPLSKAPSLARKSTTSDSGGDKKIILIEDFPNALFTSSQAPLVSFRHTIKSFLAMIKPSRSAPPLPPLVLIISESATVTGPGAFTAHRLLSAEILNHPLTASINFNKIAPTFMLKALAAVMTQESRESGRKFGPSIPLMEALTSSGDVRSAIMGLEFLAVNGDLGAFSERTTTARKKKKLGEGELNQLERKILVGVTQRESHMGIFHAIGKVVHNKRYGDDIEDAYMPPPPMPSLATHPWRSRASRVDANTLIDEAGTDAQTLISGIHENYLGSCNFLGGLSRRTHSLEDILDCVNDCLTDLSDSDLLASPRPYYSTLGAGLGGGNYDTDTAGIRQDEISFQVAVRGVMLALPSPAKRNMKDNKMFYPTSLRLWRLREEVEGVVDTFINTTVASREEMVVERLPYLRMILRARQRRTAAESSYGMKLFEMAGRSGGEVMRRLEKVVLLKGIGAQSEDVEEDATAAREGVGETELEAAEERRSGESMGKEKKKRVEEIELDVESLVLVDDDIEDDW